MLVPFFSGPVSHWGPRWAPRPSLDLPGVVFRRFSHPFGMVVGGFGIILGCFGMLFVAGSVPARPHPSAKIRGSDAPHETLETAETAETGRDHRDRRDRRDLPRSAELTDTAETGRDHRDGDAPSKAPAS